MKKLLLPLLASAALAVPVSAYADITLLAENFDNLASSGWTTRNMDYMNHRENPGYPAWFQAKPGYFDAHAGAPGSYAASDVTANVPGSMATVAWLISPVITARPGDLITIEFYTRNAGASIPGRDAMQVYVGVMAPRYIEEGTLLATIGSGNPYPAEWTKYSFQFRQAYDVPLYLGFMYGLGSESTYIGVDSVTVTALAVPEPSGWIMLGAGLAGLGLVRGKRRGTHRKI